MAATVRKCSSCRLHPPGWLSPRRRQPPPPQPNQPPSGTLRKLNFTYDPDSDCAVTYQMIGEVLVMGTNGNNYALDAGVVATSASVESGRVPGNAVDGSNTSRASRAVPQA
jgi:hypothetical protein